MNSQSWISAWWSHLLFTTILAVTVNMMAQQPQLRLIVSFNDSTRDTLRLKVDATVLKTVQDLDLFLRKSDEIGYVSFKFELIEHSSGAFRTMTSSSSLNVTHHTHLFVHVTNLDEPVFNGSQLCIKGRAFDTMNGLPILQRTSIKTLITTAGNVTTDKNIWEETTTTKLHTIRIQEQEHAELGTGLITWDGAIVLAKYLEVHQETLVRNRNILEVGAGRLGV